MRWFVLVAGLICRVLLAAVGSDAFSATRTSVVTATPSNLQVPRSVLGRTSGNVLSMRDGSMSYWFRAGDRVRVVEDVLKGGRSLQGYVGRVRETWEKCEVDPTCCCAEQVDVGMSVLVEFQDSASGDRTFDHYFAESELVKVGEE